MGAKEPENVFGMDKLVGVVAAPSPSNLSGTRASTLALSLFFSLGPKKQSPDRSSGAHSRVLRRGLLLQPLRHFPDIHGKARLEKSQDDRKAGQKDQDGNATHDAAPLGTGTHESHVGKHNDARQSQSLVGPTKLVHQDDGCGVAGASSSGGHHGGQTSSTSISAATPETNPRLFLHGRDGKSSWGS